MNWPVAYKWGRNIFAIVGVLGTLALAALVVIAFWTEAQYEQRARDAAAAADKPQASLESASSLMVRAGIEARQVDSLLGGVNPPWDGSPRAEAYCLQTRLEVSDKSWANADALDPYLMQAATAALNLAHEDLDCIPSARQLRERGLRLRVLSLEMDEGKLHIVRVAVRDPGGRVAYLVDANQPPLAQAASSASAPSTE